MWLPKSLNAANGRALHSQLAASEHSIVRVTTCQPAKRLLYFTWAASSSTEHTMTGQYQSGCHPSALQLPQVLTGSVTAVRPSTFWPTSCR